MSKTVAWALLGHEPEEWLEIEFAGPCCDLAYAPWRPINGQTLHELVMRSDYESLESRCQKAEQALRELVRWNDEVVGTKFSHANCDRYDAAWAAARAIVESK